MRPLRTSIEKIRRRDLVEAAYLTFLEHGFAGMTMARIGERAGMSHGIINYYFKSKDALLGAVVRKANFVIMSETARRLRTAETPRARVSAVIAANFPAETYTRDIARAWVSLYVAIGRHRDAERMQTAVDRRLQSNLMHALRRLAAEEHAREIATGIAVLIDGLWMRHAKTDDRMNAAAAIAHIERYVDHALERSAAPQAGGKE